MNRLIIADARKVTPAQFLRHVFGPTASEIAEALKAMPEDVFEAEYQRALREKDGSLMLLVGEKFRRCLEKPVGLTECEGDPMMKRRVA